MITYKPIIIPGGRRRDGTWPVKIRVTFKGKSRRLPTTLVCTDADLTRSGRIKNATILEKAGELIARMRGTTADLSPFTLESWDVDKVVEHIRATLTAQTFTLDFMAFGREFLKGKEDEGTRAQYSTSLNAFARYLKRDTIDVNDITRSMLIDFQDWADTQPRIYYNYHKGTYKTLNRANQPGGNASRWVARLAHIFRAAKERYNDEDAGHIVIPRSPFDSLPQRKLQHQGQKALPVEVVQRMINARPESVPERYALAAFIVSLGTMGANLADLWGAPPVKGQFWRYNRSKTADRRADHAEVIVRLEPMLATFTGILGEGTSKDWWLPSLHRWKTSRTADTLINKFLRQWCEREGLEPFTFYAARHTFATSARRLGVEKATVDEALGHLGDYRLADIYAERNWSLAWDANLKVLQQFTWPGQQYDNETDTPGAG